MSLMPMKSACMALLFGVCLELAAEPASRTFPHPDRIRYDGQCLTIDGKDVFVYSGAFHYFRCPKELWRDRFQKIKDAGFNCVETYIAWNCCEPQMPGDIDDFSKMDLTDVDDFLKMAEEFGLYVIVRPGPYICAEWDTGGFPQWLLTKRPAGATQGHWLRGDDPVYLAWCKHWFDAVCPVIARHQITRQVPGQSGVILMQLENEYDYVRFPDDVKLNQIRVLGKTAQARGIDVPFITCWTAQVRGQADPLMRQIFDCANFYPRWEVDTIQGGLEKLRREQPDAPLAMTELQGGWFSKVGGKLSEEQDGLTAAQINNLTLFAIQSGGTILNYYMLFGGTNPDDLAARDLTTSYDYAAPIREWGGIGDRYRRVWAIGHFLREHGARLARSEPVKCEVNEAQPDVAITLRRAQDGGCYFFVRTSQHDHACHGTAQVKFKTAGGNQEIAFDYQLELFGSRIFYLPPGAVDVTRGEWLPKPAPEIERPAALPAPVVITTAVTRDDPGALHPAKLKARENLAAAGVFDSHFIFYRTEVTVPAATNLLVEFPEGDAVLAEINGAVVRPLGGLAGSSVFPLPAGRSKVQLLYENCGHANGGAEIEQPSGIHSACLTGGKFGAGQPMDGWRMQLVNDGNEDSKAKADFDALLHRNAPPTAMECPELKTDFNDTAWQPVAVDQVEAKQLSPGQIAVFRAKLDFAAADLGGASTVLKFRRIDDRGWIYVNGEFAGLATDWSSTWSFDITKHLHAGRNILAVLVQNEGGDGGIGVPELAVTTGGGPVALEAFARSAGDEQKWYAPGLGETDWKPGHIGDGESAAQSTALLTWYRMKFPLPPTQSGAWIPWRLHLMASGNGFLYLNGHPIGRYWQAGPQHDFFLPECWLRFGDGQTNQLALSLRPVNGSAAVQCATVEPYSEFGQISK